MLRKVLVPGDDQGVHVGDAPARGEDAVPLAPANNLPHLQENIMLHHDEDRSNLIGEHVGIGCGRQPLARHGHNVQSLGQLVEEVRVPCFNLVPDIWRIKI